MRELTDQEIFLLDGLSRAVPLRRIAGDLGVAVDAVPALVRTVVRDLEAENEIHAVVIAIRRGLI